MSGNIKVIVRARVLSQTPPLELDGHRTCFGLQNRSNDNLYPGVQRSKDILEFLIGLPLLDDSESTLPRFRGLLVHEGKKGRQHLNLSWHYRTPPAAEEQYITGLQIPLDMSRFQIREAITGGGILEVDTTGISWGGCKKPHDPMTKSGWVVKGTWAAQP